MLSKEDALEVNHFKRELCDYCYLKLKIEKIEIALNELQTTSDDYHGLVNQLHTYQNSLERLNGFIEKSEYGQSVMLIYCTNKSTYKLESHKLFMDEKTLKRRIDRDILNFIK